VVITYYQGVPEGLLRRAAWVSLRLEGGRGDRPRAKRSAFVSRFPIAAPSTLGTRTRRVARAKRKKRTNFCIFAELPSSRLHSSIVTTLKDNSARMQKFVLFFLLALATLLVLVPSVEGAAIGKRDTNAERFARGMSPLPPVRRSGTQAARRSKPSNVP